MSSSNDHDVLIHYEGKKLLLSEFVLKNRLKEDTYTNSILDFIVDWQSESAYIFQQTSGSTGAPKQIRIDKSQMEASAKATLSYLNLQLGDNSLLCINPNFIGGKMMIARAIIGGLNLHIAPLNGNPLQGYPENRKIDFFSFVPYQLEKVIKESPDKIPFLDQSKAIILGGAPVSERLSEIIKSSFFKTKVYSTYGMTETVSHVALKRINSSQEESFKAIEGVKFSTDDRGCLVVHAPAISGQDSLITNDIVELISSTGFNWLGRADFVINSGGIKIHPEILEKNIEKIFEDNGINNRFFIFGIPNEKLGESVNLLLEGEQGTHDIMELLKDNLSAFKSPKQIFTLTAFFETESGKINRLKSIEHLIIS